MSALLLFLAGSFIMLFKAIVTNDLWGLAASVCFFVGTVHFIREKIEQ